LTKTIDKFLKRLTDIEEEFTFMKEISNASKPCSAKNSGLRWIDHVILELLGHLRVAFFCCHEIRHRKPLFGSNHTFFYPGSLGAARR
jgi:hypothetical protein